MFRRLIVSLFVLTLVTFGNSETATASTDKVSLLTFTSSDPAAPTIGPAATLFGAVQPQAPGVLDFNGRGVVTLPDRRRFNPGRGDFAFAVKFRLTRGAGNWNLAQKGYWNDPGQWKLSLHTDSRGLRLSCRFKGNQGAVHAFSKYGVVDPDGGWTRARCKREGNSVYVKVGKTVVGSARGSIGYIASAQPVLIGSKGMRASDPDQFLGLIDSFWIRS